jgi:serine/threonine-protein kinase RsbW
VGESYCLTFAAELSELERLNTFVEEKAAALCVQIDALYDVVVAIDELVTNTIVHGYRGEPGRIELELWCEQNTLHVCLRDAAPVFDPAQVPPPDVTSPLEQRTLGGLGVYMVRQYIDTMTHRALPQGGNEIKLTKCGAVVPRQ